MRKSREPAWIGRAIGCASTRQRGCAASPSRRATRNRRGLCDSLRPKHQRERWEAFLHANPPDIFTGGVSARDARLPSGPHGPGSPPDRFVGGPGYRRSRPLAPAPRWEGCGEFFRDAAEHLRNKYDLAAAVSLYGRCTPRTGVCLKSRSRPRPVRQTVARNPDAGPCGAYRSCLSSPP
jgi:hypothetical protein